MRTLENLLEHDGKIFIRLENTTVAERFLRNADKEGFLMQTGRSRRKVNIGAFISCSMIKQLNLSVSVLRVRCSDIKSFTARQLIAFRSIIYGIFRETEIILTDNKYHCKTVEIIMPM